MSRPALRYFGGKWRLAPWIISHFPAHEAYVEPFAGGASVLLTKEASAIEVYNDLDGGVVNFFAVLRDRWPELHRAIALTPFSRAELELSYEPAEDPIERARRFYVRTWQGRGGATRWKTGWRRQQSLNNRTNVLRDWLTCDRLAQVADRLLHVSIENRPALDVIREYDRPRTLFYVDPPYLFDTRGDRWTSAAYRFDTGDEASHRELLATLVDVRGMVVLSGYPHALYDDLLPGWTRILKRALGEGARKTVEALWLNPAAAGGTAQGRLLD